MGLITKWTDAEIEKLKALVASDEKLTASQIGDRIGRSRNAVISKLRSIVCGSFAKAEALRKSGQTVSSGLSRSGRSRKPIEKKPREKKPKIERRAAPKKDTGAKPTTAQPITIERIEDMNAPVKESQPVSFLSRSAKQCCWPLGDPKTPEFRVCGAVINGATQYCDSHMSLAYVPNKAA